MKKEEKKEPYELPFVNNGKPFKLEPWTVKKHKECLKEIAKYEKDLSEKQRDEKWQTILILKGLHEVDESVTEEDLDTLHPDDLISLFMAVYYQGKKGIVAKDFRKGETPNKTK